MKLKDLISKLQNYQHMYGEDLPVMVAIPDCDEDDNEGIAFFDEFFIGYSSPSATASDEEKAVGNFLMITPPEVREFIEGEGMTDIMQ